MINILFFVLKVLLGIAFIPVILAVVFILFLIVFWLVSILFCFGMILITIPIDGIFETDCGGLFTKWFDSLTGL